MGLSPARPAPKSATYYYFVARRDDGTDQVIHELLRCQVREKACISAGNTHDSEGLKPMIDGHQTRHAPQRLHADKAYDRADLRRWIRWKRIGVRIARKGANPAND